MKLTAEERVYGALCGLFKQHPGGLPVLALAEELDLSRNAASHYLNRLQEKDLVHKTDTRPARWLPQPAPTPARPSAFADFIGCDGSNRKAVDLCKSAVNYPPDGLPMILCGPSGVGKSALAKLVHQYAVQAGAVASAAPFVTLNCADYANNAQLLSGMLFGYVTGADADHEGLIHEADQGFLFLDEVHRLSFENQEKLFILLDQGCYRRMGESKGWRHVRIRLICATTEDVDQVLLKTFRRRIPVRVDIPPYGSWPLGERLQMIYHICQKEAVHIGKEIEVDPDVLGCLLRFNREGNIGALINVIRLACASALGRGEGNRLTLQARDLPDQEGAFDADGGYGEASLLVTRDRDAQSAVHTHPAFHFSGTDAFWAELSGERAWDLDALQYRFAGVDRRLCQQEPYPGQGGGFAEAHVRILLDSLRGACDHYGIGDEVTVEHMAHWYLCCCHPQEGQAPRLEGFLKHLRRRRPRTMYVMDRVLGRIRNTLVSDCPRMDLFYAALYFLLSPWVDETIQLHGLVAAHGASTASSIACVANRLAGAFIFESIDMPMETPLDVIIGEVRRYIDRVDTRQGLVLLVDMGSLSRMYTSIKSRLKGDLLIINNLTTAMALDVAIKIKNRTPFGQIAEYARTGYTTQAQYYEGLALEKNIVISCISGVGIAEKLREIVSEYVDTGMLEIITMDYHELKQLLGEQDRSRLLNTQIIITTSDLTGCDAPPILNLPDLWDPQGEELLWKCLSPAVSEQNFQRMKADLFRFFSMEGVSSRLTFLNPGVVIGEVEGVLSGYEHTYALKLDSFRRLNLFLHISVMIERLLVGDSIANTAPRQEFGAEKRDFFQVSRRIFAPIIQKYKIQIDDHELSLLYELLLG